MLTFPEAVKTCCYRKIFNWHDRAPRSEFWWFYLFTYIMNMLCSLLAIIPVVGWIAYVAWSIFALWATLMVSIRRLHDKNKSGWYLLIMWIPIFIAMILLVAVIALDGTEYDNNEGLLAFTVLSLFLVMGAAIYMLVLFVTEGTVGPNRFGPDPIWEDRICDMQIKGNTFNNGQWNANDPSQQWQQQNWPNQGFNPQQSQQAQWPNQPWQGQMPPQQWPNQQQQAPQQWPQPPQHWNQWPQQDQFNQGWNPNQMPPQPWDMNQQWPQQLQQPQQPLPPQQQSAQQMPQWPNQTQSNMGEPSPYAPPSNDKWDPSNNFESPESKSRDQESK